MKFARIAQILYTEPWLITPVMHHRLCEIFQAHVDGSAHDIDGIVNAFKHDDEEEKKRSNGFQSLSNFAIITIHGVIGRKVGDMEKSSGVLDINDVEHALKAALIDDSVEGIMLDIDSPGGAVTGVPELATFIQGVSEHKPIVAFTDGQMNSAAFWLASGADAIIATKSSEIGSIGVFLAILDRSKEFDMKGLKPELIKSGEFKGMGLPGLPLSDSHRAVLQAGVDKVFAWFSAAVNEKRSIPAEAMDGRSFFAEDAIKFDLIDKVGNIEDAFMELEDMINQIGNEE